MSRTYFGYGGKNSPYIGKPSASAIYRFSKLINNDDGKHVPIPDCARVQIDIARLKSNKAAEANGFLAVFLKRDSNEITNCISQDMFERTHVQWFLGFLLNTQNWDPMVCAKGKCNFKSDNPGRTRTQVEWQYEILTTRLLRAPLKKRAELII